MADTPRSSYRQSEVLDVELLDVFAQIEAMLRGGREVLRDLHETAAELETLLMAERASSSAT